MKYKYDFFEHLKLFIIQYTGEYNLKTYLKSQEEIQNHDKWSECSKVMVDIRSVSIPKGIKIVDDLIQARNNEKIHDYRLAYLVETPISIVIMHLYIDKLNNPNYKYCSTLKTIITHLRLEMNSQQLEILLQGLKEKEKHQ